MDDFLLLGNRHHNNYFLTRIVVSRHSSDELIYSPSILSSIRDNTKAFVCISDLPKSVHEKLVVIGGQLRQVSDAFELVVQMLFASNADFMIMGTVSLLVEDAKVGKIVGPKAATVQMIRTKSGASQIRVLKPALEVEGVIFRSLIIEGSLLAICSAHFLLHELFLDPIPSYTVSADTFENSLQCLSEQHVPQHIIMKYHELRNFLTNEFGLNLLVIQEQNTEDGNSSSDSQDSKDKKEQRCEFPIPKENAGSLIGKGGETLRALEAEFKLHIHVDKVPINEHHRSVVIIGDDYGSILRAKDKIIRMAGKILH